MCFLLSQEGLVGTQVVAIPTTLLLHVSQDDGLYTVLHKIACNFVWAGMKVVEGWISAEPIVLFDTLL